MRVPFERAILRRARRGSVSKLEKAIRKLKRRREKLVRRMKRRRTRLGRRFIRRRIKAGDRLTKKLEKILKNKKRQQAGADVQVGTSRLQRRISRGRGLRPSVRRRKRRGRPGFRVRKTQAQTTTSRPARGMFIMAQAGRATSRQQQQRQSPRMLITKSPAQEAEEVVEEQIITEQGVPASSDPEEMDITPPEEMDETQIEAEEAEEGGIIDFLWPADKPIYKRPGLWIVVAVGVGGVAYSAKKEG